MAPDASRTPPALGHGYARVDGPLKVSGTARYSSDYHFPGLLYAVPVCATVASGTVAAIDDSTAASMPGVRKVYTRSNIGTFYRPGKSGSIDEKRPPFEDDTIRYYGQYVAMVVADSFEQATAAARKVKVEYRDVTAPDVRMQLTAEEKQTTDSERGDVDAALADAAVTVDQTYTTPRETHNPIELHASLAIWDGKAFTLYETTQSIINHRNVMAQMLGVPKENVRIVTEFLGSGFGGKLWPWPHALLAAAAARDLGKPIKLVVTREMMFHDVGHRTNTQQRMRLGATPDGDLVALRQDFLYATSRSDHTKEDCGEATPFLYSTANLKVTSACARRDIAPNTAMRGPGAVPGLFAVESAMDELALALKMDPVELRLRNEPEIDESENIPFSSRHLKECLTEGAKRFGWSQRDPAIGAMRKDGKILGWGVAACSWMAQRLAAEVSVLLNADGSVRVASGTQDIGTGTYTMLAQMVAHDLGIAVDRVKVVIGDSALPPGPLSGGSMATGSLVPAVAQAAGKAVEQLLDAAAAHAQAFKGAKADQLAFTDGRVHRKDTAAESGVPFAQVLDEARLAHVEGKGKSGSTFGDDEAKKFSMHSYGAHFVEVSWEPQTARLRIERVLTVIDAGRIINPMTGRNQIEGAIAMGVGMALFEETQYEARWGKAINSNLADYVMTTHADSPAMDVLFLDYPDTKLNSLGARGIGEIGLAGFAAAVTSAVHHATGVRVRHLPVKIEDLLASTVS
ncbi:xanthine dehydrogenase family protein molybdopterin-binding subunit [Dyella sp.]|jgi:xanthine dehydrogenase YagR molybdenum-binding subunit|uniref:xanthine dehydrogenase family protein molybdopterin-binding subunit n=1 Tax=Dyella sp. TaxID=1869338 RepID=UPI002D79A448|nr:xanthine dehydrogenase family protein molybdopterin-binding subunit [Dyella sp.]HET6432806.1 xanthine dehydrogenase family protein molybdopterin-binding subunit [Dyella sp.]